MKVSLLQKRVYSAILFSVIALFAQGQITKEDRGSRGYFEYVSAYGSGSILANMRDGAYGSETGYALARFLQNCVCIFRRQW